MKSCYKIRPALLIPAMGLTALALRQTLLHVCLDEKGLLPSGHPLLWLLWLVTAAAALTALLSVRRPEDIPSCGDGVSAAKVPAAGTVVLAAGVCVSVLTRFSAGSRLELIRNILGVLAVPALVYAGLWRMKGKQPFFLAYALICGFFTLHTVSLYPGWSSRPQMLHYIFAAIACIFLMLFSYHQTALCVGMGQQRIRMVSGLLAAFGCLAALGGTGDDLLYLTAAVWTLTETCRAPSLPEAPAE